MASMAAMGIAGRYPMASSRGHKYMLVMADVGSGHIFYEALKPRKSDAITEACRKCYKRLTDKGLAAELARLGNEASHQLIEAFKED